VTVDQLPITQPEVEKLTARADRLRSLHRPGDPLVLVNAWDVASARHVHDAGALAVGTSSAAIADSLGLPDDPTAPLPIVFEAVARIVAAVTVPVTADLLDGYGLPETELVDRLLHAGAVGCNLEDSDHTHPGRLLDPDVVASRLTAVRAAGRARGVDVVVNARIDTSRVADGADPAATWSDTVRRAERYLDAGADCVFPFGMSEPRLVSDLVAALGGAPVNASVPPGVSVADMAVAGASRVSLGPVAHRVAMAAFDGLAADLLGRG
jgi:2-methylisocitrate lyase-like PEP mutase family enzyme